MENHSEHFSNESFWDKVREFGKKIPFLRDALAMYYCIMDEETPVWVKTIIISALGYFIFPLDAVPDFIPVAGFLDDAGIITAALAVISAHIKPEHWQQADDFLNGL